MSPIAPAVRMRRGLAASVIVGVAALAAMIVAAVIAAPGERGIVVVAWSALTPLFALSALPMMRSALREHAPAVVLVGAVGAAPAIVLGAAIALGEPIAHAGFTCGTGQVGLAMCAMPFVAVVVATTTAVVTWRAREGFGRMLPVAALVAAIVTGVVVIGGELRLQDRPEPDAWARSLPVTVEILDRTRERATYRIAHDVALERECSDGYCNVSLRRVGFDGAIGEELTDRVPACAVHGWLNEDDARQVLPAPAEVCGSYAGSVTGATLRVHRATASAPFVIESDSTTLAFGSDLEPVTIVPGELARALAPPRTFVNGALVGLLLALITLGARFAVARRARVIGAGREGVVDDHGIVFDDGQLPARGALANEAPLGPAVAIADSATPGYRDDGTRSAWRVWPGTRADQLRTLAARRATCDAAALAFLVLTAAPLALAACLGFVF